MKGEYIYVLNCDGNRIYIGWTNNIYNRIKTHFRSTGCGYTGKYRPCGIEAIYNIEEMAKFFKSHHNMEFSTGKRFENFISEIILSHNNPGHQCVPVGKICGGKYCRIGTNYVLTLQGHMYDQIAKCKCGVPAIPFTDGSNNIVLECPKKSLKEVKNILGIPGSSVPCDYYSYIGYQSWSCPKNNIIISTKIEIKWILDRPESTLRIPIPYKSAILKEIEIYFIDFCNEERSDRNIIRKEEKEIFNKIVLYHKNPESYFYDIHSNQWRERYYIEKVEKEEKEKLNTYKGFLVKHFKSFLKLGIIDSKNKENQSHITDSLRRTIRFKYYGYNTDQWQDLRKLLLENKPSTERDSFLNRWASKCGLTHLPRCESVIGNSTIVGKDLRLKKTYEDENINDIIITNINPGHYDTTEWTISELSLNLSKNQLSLRET